MNGFVFIPATQNSGLMSIFNRSSGGAAPNFSNGETINATLTAREDGRATLLTQDDFSFSVPADSVRGEVGDVLQFRVVSRDNSGLALRQILPQAALDAAITRGNAGIDDVKMVATSLEQMAEAEAYRNEAQKEEQVRAAQAVAQIRRSQRSMSSSATQTAIAAIAASGLDINKISFFELNNIIREIEGMADAPGLDTDVPDAAAQKSFERVRDLLAGGLTDSAVAQILRGGKDITPEQVYAGRYAGGQSNPAMYDNWENLDRQLARRFDRLGIENTAHNQDAARFLLSHDLPITRYNVDAAVLLRNINMLPDEFLMEQVKVSLAAGEDPTHMKLLPLLSTIDMGAVLDTVKKLPDLMPQDVKTVMEAGKPLDLHHISEAAKVREEAPVGATEPVAQYHVPEQRLITAQRQLVEIQWQMTVQSAIRLAHKGIEINTEPLQELVMHLRALERDGHAASLRALGVADSAQNVTRMEDIFRTVKEIRPVVTSFDAGISAKVMAKEIDFNLAGLHKASVAYEASATVPNARYGDTFAKVQGQFGSLLERMEITPSAENIRAAAILSRNNLDVELTAIEAIKLIDAKMTAVMDRLHPMVAAQMLKEGLQPLNMSMDDMLSYIRAFEKFHGYSGWDKVAQYIHEMDRGRALNNLERDGMIAVYRMLNLIQKNGAAALGMGTDEKLPLTMGRLMEAAKVFDKNGRLPNILDAATDDAFGRLELPPGSIRSALSKAASLSYTDLLADALVDKGEPDTMQKWIKDENRPLEDVLQQTEAKPFSPDTEQAAQALKQFAEAPPGLIAMLQNSGIMPTPAAIKAARRMNENGLLESLQDAADEVRESNAGLGEALNNEFKFEDIVRTLLGGGGQKEAVRKIWDVLSDAVPTPAVREAQDLLAAQYAMDDEDIELPIMLNGRFASLKLYTLNEDAVAAGTAKTFLSLNTAGLGNVQSFFEMDGDRINLQFTVDSPAARVRLESHLNTLRLELLGAGYDIGGISFAYNVAETAVVAQGKDVSVDPDEDFVMAPVDVSDFEYKV